MFVRRVVVGNYVNVVFGRRFSIDEAQKRDPILMGMTLSALIQEFAVQHIQGSKERGGAVAFIVVRHGCAATLLERCWAGFDPAPGSDSSHPRKARWRAGAD